MTTQDSSTGTGTFVPARCDHRSEYGLGCARSADHDGAHWLTSSPDEARADLVRQGWFVQPTETVR